jgi:pimeloyl-ACP methyl ester carboxylesterase
MSAAADSHPSKSPLRPVRRHRVMLDAGVALDGAPSPKIAAEIAWPADDNLLSPPLALVCLPGGSINRRYFDLSADDQPSFSFVRHMAHEGMITISIDHLGVGESTRPADEFALTPNLLAAANVHATRQAVEGLKAGTLVPGLRPLPDLATIGVGHSMGGMLTVMQQAIDPRHIALVLLGHSNAGHIKFLPEPAHALIGVPEAIPDQIAAIARQFQATAAPDRLESPERRAIFYGEKAEKDGVAALKLARDTLLVVAGLQTLIPGSIAPQMKTIEVPVFLGVGDQDIVGPTHAIPAVLPNSRDISLLVLPDTGHCHFIFPSRHTLFERIAQWTRMIRP